MIALTVYIQTNAYEILVPKHVNKMTSEGMIPATIGFKKPNKISYPNNVNKVFHSL